MGEKLTSFEENSESQEQLRGLDGLKESIKQTSERFQSLGIPVDENLRLTMSEDDTRKSDEISKDFENDSKYGERLELLTVYLLNKYLDDKEFVSVRSARLDDYKNKVDIVILDKKTKTVLCAIDDVGATKGYHFENKKKEIEEINLEKNGTALKYGLNLDEEGRFIIREERNIPITYLALNNNLIRKTIKGMNSSKTEDIQMEKKIFNYFLSSIDSSLRGLGLVLENKTKQSEEELSKESEKKLIESQKLLKKISDLIDSLGNKTVEE